MQNKKNNIRIRADPRTLAERKEFAFSVKRRQGPGSGWAGVEGRDQPSGGLGLQSRRRKPGALRRRKWETEVGVGPAGARSPSSQAGSQ